MSRIVQFSARSPPPRPFFGASADNDAGADEGREENAEEESKEQAYSKETIIHHHIQRERDLHVHTDKVKN